MMRILIGLCLFGSLQTYSMDSQDQVQKSSSREKISPMRGQTSPRQGQKVTTASPKPKRLKSLEDVAKKLERDLMADSPRPMNIPDKVDRPKSPKVARVIIVMNNN